MTPPSPLIAEHRLQQRVAELAAEITRDYAGRELDLVYAINGASVFCADLARQIGIPTRLHPLGFSSYGVAVPTGEVRITLDVAAPLHGRDVLLVEGVIVTGRTPKYIADMLQLRRPAGLAVCALGVKRALMTAELVVRYVGFPFDTEMVVGYGIGEGPEKSLPFLAAR